jgi:hypothetical protein
MNLSLYRARGLAAIHRCLRPGGVLGVWSADPDPRFLRTLRHAGFSPRSETVHARNVPRGTTHEIYIARRR